MGIKHSQDLTQNFNQSKIKIEKPQQNPPKKLHMGHEGERITLPLILKTAVGHRHSPSYFKCKGVKFRPSDFLFL